MKPRPRPAGGLYHPGPWLALLLVLCACRDAGQADYLQVSGKLFVFNYRIAEATYLLTLNRLRPLPEETRLKATFDNPAGGEPLVVEQRIWPTMERITVQSPPVKCVKAHKEYHVVIELVDAGGAKLQTIERMMVSDTDQSLMPDKPLVVGPLYDANPDRTPDKQDCPAS